jgi:hypothetical protein
MTIKMVSIRLPRGFIQSLTQIVSVIGRYIKVKTGK